MITCSSAHDYEHFVDGALVLWKIWAQEEHGHDLDEDAWRELMAMQIQSDMFFQVVAWDEDEDPRRPVGMVEGYLVYDPSARKLVGHGDHAYVLPEYRGRGVFRVLFDFVLDAGFQLGSDEVCLPVGIDEQGQILQQMYEKEGFVVRGHFMRRSR